MHNQEYTAHSPGRLDVMGGISDYSGSLLLQMPLAEGTTVTLGKRSDGIIHITTDTEAIHGEFHENISGYEDLDYASAGQKIKALPGGDWAVYVLGCFLVLQREKGLLWEGASLTVKSNLPSGKGVSSSAAIEVATMQAIRKAYGLELDYVELAVLAQKVENRVVGAACGLMDQLSVNLGKKDHLLPIICQPHTVFDPIPIPKSIRFLGLDSGVRHAVGGTSYGDVRTAAFMAYSIVAHQTGTTAEELFRARETGDWSGLPYSGFLANIPRSKFLEEFQPLLPATMRGADFLENYRVSIDAVTEIDPGKTYALGAAAAHPVHEHFRVQRFMQYLQDLDLLSDREGALRAMGELMMQSHASYTSVGLGEPVTDAILAMAREYGPENGVYGAKISGGGSGGTVVFLASEEKGVAKVETIRDRMQEKTGKALYLFSQSGEGSEYLNRLT